MESNEAKERRENVKSKKIILRRDSKEDFIDHNIIDSEKDLLLKSFLQREVGYNLKQGETPKHIEIMQQQELVGYESSSDIGHFKFYPKGALMKDLLEDLAQDVAISRIGATKIHTPILYRAEVPDIAEQAASFHERDYRLNLEDRQLLLRFAGDFGLFSMMKNAVVSHKQLPIRIYEFSPSFRLEKSGECCGLKRLRAFTMPDIHCFCEDLKSALKEFGSLHDFYDDFMNETGLPFALAFRTTEDFWKDGKEFILQRLDKSKKDSIVEILEQMKHYWVLKNEFQYIDSIGDNVQLSTVQLDISDSERYGLGYTTSDGTKKPFVIVHSSMGSLERILGAIIEERGKEITAGGKATFPYWLSPTQLRLIPITYDQIPHCVNFAEKLKNIRVDIDDRSESLNKKVRAAEKEWIPAYIVIGKKEIESERYDLKTRGKEFETVPLKGLTSADVSNHLSRIQGERPFRQSYLNRRVSKQLRFGSAY